MLLARSISLAAVATSGSPYTTYFRSTTTAGIFSTPVLQASVAPCCAFARSACRRAPSGVARKLLLEALLFIQKDDAHVDGGVYRVSPVSDDPGFGLDKSAE